MLILFFWTFKTCFKLFSLFSGSYLIKSIPNTHVLFVVFYIFYVGWCILINSHWMMSKDLFYHGFTYIKNSYSDIEFQTSLRKSWLMVSERNLCFKWKKIRSLHVKPCRPCGQRSEKYFQCVVCWKLGWSYTLCLQGFIAWAKLRWFLVP